MQADAQRVTCGKIADLPAACLNRQNFADEGAPSKRMKRYAPGLSALVRRLACSISS